MQSPYRITSRLKFLLYAAQTAPTAHGKLFTKRTLRASSPYGVLAGLACSTAAEFRMAAFTYSLVTTPLKFRANRIKIFNNKEQNHLHNFIPWGLIIKKAITTNVLYLQQQML